MTNRTTRSIAALAAVAALGLGGAVAPALARHGADDPPGHDAGDDHGGARPAAKVRIARHGADDGPRHHHRHGGHGRHHDDGPNHR